MFIIKEKNIIDFIKNQIIKSIYHVVDFFNTTGIDRKSIKVNVEKTKNPKFGDYTTNCAMTIGLNRDQCMKLASLIADNLNKKYFRTATAVNPGFINMELRDSVLKHFLAKVVKKGDKYGVFKNQKINYEIEFVSANPTGLLHLGHARNAAIGDTLARIWQANGINVTREYYINDAGNQIDKLALSVLIRYRNLFDYDDILPEDSYHANEIIECAKEIKEKFFDKFVALKHNNEKIIPYGENEEELLNELKTHAKNFMLERIKKSLNSLGVNMDIWFSESTLYKNHLIENVFNILQPHIYKVDGATWLKTTDAGDDKDRVLVKSDGQYTYFTPDIAYHAIKMARGYDKIFNVWGSDHDSYTKRIKIAMQFCGFNPDNIVFIMMQMIRLMKDGQEYKMSKRTGNGITLDDLVNALGKDCARWFLVSQAANSHLDIDINQALSKDNNNPYFYVQYAYARINQILAKQGEYKNKSLDGLVNPAEKELIKILCNYPILIKNIGNSYDVNLLPAYLTTLAKAFHSYYSQVKILDPLAPELSMVRCNLLKCVAQVIKNGLKLMNIKPLEKM